MYLLPQVFIPKGRPRHQPHLEGGYARRPSRQRPAAPRRHDRRAGRPLCREADADVAPQGRRDAAGRPEAGRTRGELRRDNKRRRGRPDRDGQRLDRRRPVDQSRDEGAR